MEELFQKLKNDLEPTAILACATAKCFQQQWQEAFNYAQRFELYMNQNNVPQAGAVMENLYFILSESSFLLGNLMDAKKYLRHLKKYLNDGQVVSLERNIKKALKKKKKKPKVKNYSRPLKKCFYDFCENMETKPGKFQSCMNCDTVFYCSKACQKEHWKIDHKFICTKFSLKDCSQTCCTNVETKPNQFQKCGRCGKAYYCSRKCQKDHWKVEHKKCCGKN